MSQGMFDKTMQGLATNLNMRLLKQNVHSSNIANAETPGFKAQKLEFEDALSSALQGQGRMLASHDQHFTMSNPPAVTPSIYDNPDGPTNNDGNTVDLEKEMSALAENQVMYKAALQLINKKIAALKYAASEGR